MTKIKLFGLLLISTVFFTLNAASYKGLKIYTEVCKNCHDDGEKFAVRHTIRTWEKIMDNKGDRLMQYHLNSKEAQVSWEYFQDFKSKRDYKHLEDFITEYAKDSGYVPKY